MFINTLLAVLRQHIVCYTFIFVFVISIKLLCAQLVVDVLDFRRREAFENGTKSSS